MQFAVKVLKPARSAGYANTLYFKACVHVQTCVDAWHTSDLHLLLKQLLQF